MKFFFLIITTVFLANAQSQSSRLSGIVIDDKTREPLSGASVTVYQPSGIAGTVTNTEGRFSITIAGKADSIRVSMIGYRGQVYFGTKLFYGVSLAVEATTLNAVVVRPPMVNDIIHRAAEKIRLMRPAGGFEERAFYREVIRDTSAYYSVSEAIFKSQSDPQKKAIKLQLVKGRSKEDVAYTRLFEDFHPGGGPEGAFAQSLVVGIPDFLNESKLSKYVYRLDSTLEQDDKLIYVIGFDQRPEIHEALEKGKLYIDADEFTLLKFDAKNSPAGSRYMKSLKGTDKVFAEILHIDFINKGWSRNASYRAIDGKLFLSHARMDYSIIYKQPKKDIDLNLDISTELVVTEFNRKLSGQISKDVEWKRKDLVANLPTNFDTAFWGGGNILDPDREIQNIVGSIQTKNNDRPEGGTIAGWTYLHKEFFSAYLDQDTLTIIPLAKCSWEDDQTGGMIFKLMSGDFSIEAKLWITKKSNANLDPDNGFQQAGLIIRSNGGDKENNLIYSYGTGGNSTAKYFIKRTINGKTKAVVNKTGGLSSWLKLEKLGKKITIFTKTDEGGNWIKLDNYEFDWLGSEVQTGFSIMDRFAGDGPKQHPDMKARFSKIILSPK